MIIEQDKTDPTLFVATGKIFGHPIIAEAESPADAFTQWIICATERLEKDLDDKAPAERLTDPAKLQSLPRYVGFRALSTALLH